MKNPLTPHLQEINILKSFLANIVEWIGMYKNLQKEESDLVTLVSSSTSFWTKQHYKRKLKVISKRLDQLSKRLVLKDLLKTFEVFSKRITELYEYDKQLLSDPLHPRKEWRDEE